MNEIVLTAEQASIVASTEGSVAIRHPNGELLGWIEPLIRQTGAQCPFTNEEVAAAEMRADETGVWHTTKEVLEHLQSLDQRQQ